MKKTITALALVSALGGLPEGIQAHSLEGKLAVPPHEYKLPNLKNAIVLGAKNLQDKRGNYAGIYAGFDLDYDGEADLNIAARYCSERFIKHPFGVFDIRHHAIYLDYNMDGIFDERIDDHIGVSIDIPDCPLFQKNGYEI